MTIGAYAVSWWLTLILAGLAVTGLCVTLWKLLDMLRSAADWWQDRREPIAGHPASELADAPDCGECGHFHPHTRCVFPCLCETRWGEPEYDLPPERSGEELGFTDNQAREHWASGRCWCDEFHRDQAETIALTERPPGTLEPDIHCNFCVDGCVRCDPRKQDEYRWSPQMERRAPWWEAEHRAAYESLGLDYPSGLVARIRDLVS